MSENAASPFQERLNALFERGLPDGTRATPTEVARRAREAGFQVSRPYIGQLRSGKARNPALTTIDALAAVFEVEPNYFFGRAEMQGRAYDIAAAAADDPEAIIAGAGEELDEEGRGHLASYIQFLRSERRHRNT